MPEACIVKILFKQPLIENTRRSFSYYLKNELISMRRAGSRQYEASSPPNNRLVYDLNQVLGKLSY